MGSKAKETTKLEAPLYCLKQIWTQGHQGEAGRYASLKEVAFEYAFAIKVAGLEM